MCIVYSIPIFFVVFATGNPPLTSSAQMHRCQMLTLQRMESTCKMFLSLSMHCCAYAVFGTLQLSFPHSSVSTCSLFTFHDRSMSHSARVTTQCHPLIFWQKISSNTFFTHNEIVKYSLWPCNCQSILFMCLYSKFQRVKNEFVCNWRGGWWKRKLPSVCKGRWAWLCVNCMSESGFLSKSKVPFMCNIFMFNVHEIGQLRLALMRRDAKQKN